MGGLVGEIAREGLVNLASNFTMKAMPSVSSRVEEESQSCSVVNR